MAAEFFRLALEDEDVFLPPVDPFCDVISTSDAACCDDRPSFGLIGGFFSLSFEGQWTCLLPSCFVT